MANAFQELLRLITNGDPVDQATINRILGELDGNARYIRDLFLAAALGETVIARDQTVDSGVLVGQPVYYDEDTQAWQLAIAATQELEPGVVELAPSAFAWGVIHTKTDSTLADILLMGFDDIDMSDAIDGTVTPGQYFLSGAEAGKLVRTQPAVGVPVLQAAGAGETAGTTKVFVKTSFYDVFNSHRHYQFDLQTLPAGNAFLGGGVWVINDPDTDIEGWLPADDPIFDGTAPAGAKFGYNLSASAIQNFWPPLPVSSGYLEWNRGESAELLGMGVPLGEDGLAIIDTSGIWWMSDCPGEVPWDVFEGTTTTPSP